jgi:hypothetical protein
MKHLAKIQIEFLKEARSWDKLSLEDQKAYLKRHPKSKRKITAKPKSKSKSEEYKVGDKVIGKNKQGLPHDEYKGTYSSTQKNGDIVINLDKPLKSTSQNQVVLSPDDVMKQKSVSDISNKINEKRQTVNKNKEINLDFTDLNAVKKVLKKFDIDMTDYVANGPGGGNPNATFKGSQENLEKFLKWYDSDQAEDLTEMIEDSKPVDKKDLIDDFMNDFSDKHGSAAEIWMNDIDREKFYDMYKSNKYKFKTKNVDEVNEDKMYRLNDKMKEQGYKLLADDDNIDQYDSIWYKSK